MPLRGTPFRSIDSNTGPWADSLGLVRTSRIPHVLLATGLALSTLGLTGCFNGPAATTSVQSAQLTGNGVQAQAGDIRAENLTLVLGPEGSSSATLATRIVNGGPESDALLSVLIDGVPAYITGDVVEFLPGQSIGFGFESDMWINAYQFAGQESTYVDVALQFEKAGITEAEVLIVPPLGYYEGIEPVPPAA